LTEQILQALSTDEKVEEILHALKNGDSYESIVERLGRSPIEDLDTMSPRTSQHSTFDVSDHEMGGTSVSTNWTTVTSDKAVLDHLFQLYFAWIHPVHTLFSEGRFVDSYQQQSEDYCSSVLVNAICAMACHLHSAADADEVDYVRLADDFSDAVRNTINSEDRSVTTIQAFAVMFLVDCSRANGLRASSYLRVAINSLPNVDYQESEGFTDVWKHTVRGVQNLNVLVFGLSHSRCIQTNRPSEWAQMTFQVPAKVDYATLDAAEENDLKLDDARWYYYRFVNDQCPAWPGLLATTNREKAKLIAIIQDVATMLYSQQGPRLSAHHVLQQYGRFVAWEEHLPKVIGDIENNNSQALPHVLSLLYVRPPDIRDSADHTESYSELRSFSSFAPCSTSKAFRLR
jgi:hypothetical protein